MYIVTYTDYGDTCDGHTRVLDSYETDEKAELEVFKDMDRYAKDHKNVGDSVEFRSCSHEVWLNGNVGEQGCVWDIHEVNNAIPTSVF